MKKFYSILVVCSFLLAALVPQKVLAGAATFENHVVTLTGVPEGAGVVYLVTEWNGHEWDEIDDMLYEEDEITVKATIETKGYMAICNLYALPNEGYQFAGFWIDEDQDGLFDVEFDKPITFSDDSNFDNTCVENGAPRAFTNSPALQVVLPNETREYNIEGAETADNKAAAEAAAETDWEEFGCLNHFFAVFYKDGEENPATGIKAMTINPDEVIYNLCGQRVGKDAKGFLIVGGKKKFIR
ncbi:MAG: hypothetical protein J6Y84_06600 [Bacteroidaceae bacterium]|nr:hypothetical protein [Bacteroidaceae bacterium]